MAGSAEFIRAGAAFGYGGCMDRGQSIDRRSIAPMLAARAAYQFYLWTFSVVFSVVAMIIATAALLSLSFGVANSLIYAFRLAGEVFSGTIAEADVFRASPYLGTIFGANPVRAIIAFILFSVIALIAVPLVFLVLKAAADDLLHGILIILIFCSGYPALKLSGPSGIFPRDLSEINPANVLQILSSSVFAVFAVLHLLCALVLRLFSLSRLSITAPRIGLRVSIGKYAGSRWDRLWRATRPFLPALGSSLLRAVGFSVVISLLFLLWDTFVLAEPKLSNRYGPLIAFGPLAVAFILSTAMTLWALLRQPGLRLLNLGLLIAVLPNIPTSVVFKFAFFKTRFPDGFPVIGDATILLAAVAFRGFLFAPLRDAFLQFRQSLIRTASEIAANSRKAPILLLRAFADDQARVAASFRTFTFAFGGHDATKPLEEVIAEALFARGPVIALSDPRAKSAPPLGAARDASTDLDWQSYILRRIEETQLVAVVVSRTDNLSWEIDQLAAHDVLERTIFITPPGYPADRTINALSEQAARSIGIDMQCERALGRRARAVCFDKERARWTALTSPFATERSYIEAIRIAAGLALYSTSPLRCAGRNT
jgi:hypothetical protein